MFFEELRLVLKRLDGPYGGPNGADDVRWTATVCDDDEELSFEVYATSTGFQTGDLTFREWITERLNRWPSENYDNRSHLRQIQDAAPIQLFPVE